MAYLPHDPLISVVQSFMEEYAMRRSACAEAAGRTSRAVRGPTKKDLPPVTAQRLCRASGPAPRAPVREVLAYQTALGAVRKLSEWFTRWNHPHEFRDAERPEVVRVKQHPGCVLVGDWGFRHQRAARVANYMRKAVEDALGAKRIRVRPRQPRRHLLLGLAPRVHRSPAAVLAGVAEEAKKAGSWILNGNHDMYSGGDGYYELLDKEERFAGPKGLSFFHLQNKYWDLLGLDTAYKDHDLGREATGWRPSPRKSRARPCCSATSHQPLSSNDGGGNLRKSSSRTSCGRSRLWTHDC